MVTIKKIQELRNKRNSLWEQAKKFLAEHRDENGLVSADDLEYYDNMTAEVKALGDEIQQLKNLNNVT